MKLGVCYYPEHWPPERWPVDAKLMREAGLSIVRLAEFAWQKMEPAEGQYDWDWLDTAIETLAAEGLQIVLGTPTATPPAWLCKAHPDILPTDSQGRRRNFGSRRHYCANNPTYRAHTRRIVAALAGRYGQHPAIIGWQIDNEFGDHNTARCYCHHCAAAFREWLKEKYETIQSLNAAWGTVFWSQTYDDWCQVEPPVLPVAEPNPSLALDFYRFSSDTFVAYQHLQIQTLKPKIQNQFITTNFMGNFPDLNYHDLARPLDFVAWDSYPTGYAEVHAQSLYAPDEARPAFAYDLGDPFVTGFCHALMWGLKQAPVWIMEQQCGNINWSLHNTGLRPGAMRLWTWHALASGAEAVIYFRWRATVFAQEQYHSGLLHHDASLATGYNELLAMQAERGLMAQLAAEPLNSQAALLLDYDDLWAIQLQPHRKDFGYLRHHFVHYRALQRLGIPADIVPAEADLSKYKLVIAPTALIGKERTLAALKTFAENGGTILLGVRSGFKTETNRATDQPLPGLYHDLVGATVTDWHSLPPHAGFNLASTIPGLSGRATLWAESIQPFAPDLKHLALYTSGPFTGQAALTEHELGKGRAFYLGFYPTDAQAKALLAHLARRAGVKRQADLPHGLIAARRGARTLLLNFTDEPLATTVGGQTVEVGPRDVQVI